MICKKIVIIGSRRRDDQEDFDTVYQHFQKVYNEGDIIVSGGCPKGGDRFAEIIARRLGLTEENGKLIVHRPKKPVQGSPKWMYTKAFYERNTLVAREVGLNDIVIACVAPDRTGGTEDTLKKITRLNKVDLNNIYLI